MKDSSIALRWLALLAATILLAAGCGSDPADPAASPEPAVVAGDVDPGGAPGPAEAAAGDEDPNAVAGGAAPGERAGLSSLRAAADRSVAATSVSFDYAMSMTGIPGAPGGELTMQGSGASDLALGRSEMTVDLSGFGAAGSMETITDGAVAYLRMPLFAGLYGLGPDQWIRVDSGVDAAQLGTGGPDASAMLAYLQGAGEVEEVGREAIDGVETTHYAGRLSLAGAVESAPQAERERLRSMLEQIDPTGTVDIGAEYGFDVWIGDDDLVRRLSLSMDLGAMSTDASLQGTAMVMTMTFRDYGVPVAIEVPTDWVDSAELPGF